MRDHNVKILVVFVWALAHGIWMGAGWHAAEVYRPNSNTATSALTCAGCTRQFSSRSSPRDQMTDANPAVCHVCQLSSVMPDVPEIAALSLSAVIPTFAEPQALPAQRCITPDFTLPLTLAPPFIS